MQPLLQYHGVFSVAGVTCSHLNFIKWLLISMLTIGLLRLLLIMLILHYYINTFCVCVLKENV